MSIRVFAAVGVFLLTSVTSVFPASITLNTGLDASTNLITTNGALDAHWTVDQIGGGTAAAQVVTPVSPDWGGPPWLPNGPNSTWIARNAGTSDNGSAPSTFYRTFDLTGFNLATTVITGGWTVDDDGVLKLNGNL